MILTSFHTHSYNDSGIWNWNTHDGDWIYPGGDDYTAVKHNMMYNSINDLDDSPVGWHITEVCTKKKQNTTKKCSCIIIVRHVVVLAIDEVEHWTVVVLANV